MSGFVVRREDPDADFQKNNLIYLQKAQSKNQGRGWAGYRKY